MDFHQLLAKMQELDRPANQPTAEECGMMPPASPMGMTPGMPSKPDTPPPSMSVNLNAQGMDNIEQMMKLFQKVNPDMMPKIDPIPSMAPPPSIMSIKPNLPPLKMLPDLDADNDDKVGGEKDLDEPKDVMIKMGSRDEENDKGSQPGGLGASLDRDGDGDHDMDDHDLEPKDDDEDKKEAWVNEPDEEEKDIDYMVNKLAGGMNKSHGTYPKVAVGDNPMQKITRMEGEELRAQIRAELQKRLAEAKGAK